MKKVFCLVLTALLIVGLVPATTFADLDPVCKIGSKTYGSLEAALDDANSGAVIEILDDCETDRLEILKNVTIVAADGVDATLTLHGAVLIGDASNSCTVTFGSNSHGGMLTIVPMEGADFRPIAIRGGSTLNIKNGVALEGNSINNFGGMIFVQADATLNMFGGVIKDCSAYYGGAVSVSGTFNMFGGIITNCSAIYASDFDMSGRGGLLVLHIPELIICLVV